MATFDPRVRPREEGSAIAVGLYRIAQAIGILLRRKGQEHGLSASQVQALLFLAYSRPGVRTVSGLAQRLGCRLATASDIAMTLERKGLVRRYSTAGRGRTVFLALTPAGEALVQQLDNVLDVLEEGVQALPAATRTGLKQGIQALVRHLVAAGYVVAYEMCWECAFFRPFAHPDRPEAPHHCAFMDAPLPVEDTYTECPDYVPKTEEAST